MNQPQVIDADVVVGGEQGLVMRQTSSLVVQPVMDLVTAKRRMEELQSFCREYLKESTDGGNDGGDYGILPGGGQKKVLYKSGTDKLCDVYALSDRYKIVRDVMDWESGLFFYLIECSVHSKVDDRFLGTGLGSCTSFEAKYRWRVAGRVCPTCGKDAIIRGKEEYGGGWLCFRKKGGCNAKFAIDDQAIISQPVGRIENEDLADTVNTILKMAKKRAKNDGVIGVTRSSGIFTTDIEVQQGPGGDNGKVSAPAASSKAEPAKTSAPANPAASAAPNVSNGGGAAAETHAERIARVKAEHEAAQKGATQPAKAPTPAAAVTPAAQAPASQASAEQPAAPAAPAGSTTVQAVNTKQGPQVMKMGKAEPAFTVYIVTFKAKVTATNGVQVRDASTSDEKIAEEASGYRDAETPVIPKVSPSTTRKGAYILESFQIAS